MVEIQIIQIMDLIIGHLKKAKDKTDEKEMLAEIMQAEAGFNTLKEVLS